MKLKKVRRVLLFKQKPFMKIYIDKNTKLRMKAKNAFEKDFFKLMNNSVFGKTIENMRNRINIHLIKDTEEAEKLVNRPNFDDLKIFDEFLIAIKMKKTKLFFNKPTYVGMSILDLSKTLMYDFHYNYAKKKWKDVKVLYTDTDSLFYEIETEDFFADIADDVEKRFDTSDFPKDHKSCIPVGKNKKVIEKFKDENGGIIMTEFAALRPKCYSFLLENGKGEKKAEGIKKCVVKKELNHKNFVNCLLTGKTEIRKQNVIRSHDHHLFTATVKKIALSADDNKRVVLANKIETLALGHWRLN